MEKVYSVTGKMVDSKGRYDLVTKSPTIKKEGAKSTAVGAKRERGVHTVKLDVYKSILAVQGLSLDTMPFDANNAKKVAEKEKITIEEAILDAKITSMVQVGNDFMSTATDYYLANFAKITAMPDLSKKDKK